jgi:hypothetical protein
VRWRVARIVEFRFTLQNKMKEIKIDDFLAESEVKRCSDRPVNMLEHTPVRGSNRLVGVGTDVATENH